jgi:tripartite-type tricarboxylate transporter receptor subunit TctC
VGRADAPHLQTTASMPAAGAQPDQLWLAAPVHVTAGGHVRVALSMKRARRRFLHLVAGAVAVPMLSRIAGAQAYPARPVHLIVAFPAAGPNDILARLIGQWLSERLGQPFVIENRDGAGGNVGTEAVVKAAADGYTLLLVDASAAFNATLYDNLTFNFIRDIAPVAGITRAALVLVVKSSFPAKTVPELIAYAKDNPGKVNFASGGNGTASHIAGELFKMLAGVNLLHVPYRGGAPALTDLLGGQVEMMFITMSATIEYIRAGKVRALAVTTIVPSQALPDVPSMSNFLPGYEVSTWNGIGAPKNTPKEVVGRLNTEINAILADPKMTARLVDLGGMTLPGSPSDFGRLVGEEIKRYAKVIRTANIKAE